MSDDPGPNRRIRMVLAILATVTIAVTVLVVAAPAGAAATANPTCTVGAPVTFNGQRYCPGSTIGVARTTYGLNKRVVLQGVGVLDVQGTTATVQGGPLCPTGQFCGAILTSIRVSVSGLTPRPVAGTVIDLYGITRTGTLTSTGYVQKGESSCSNPDFC